MAIVVALAAMAGGVALALRSEDAYRPGTTHEAMLVLPEPCMSWNVRLDDDHAWVPKAGVPDHWESPMAGRLRILSGHEAVFEATAGGSVLLVGGDGWGPPAEPPAPDCIWVLWDE